MSTEKLKRLQFRPFVVSFKPFPTLDLSVVQSLLLELNLFVYQRLFRTTSREPFSQKLEILNRGGKDNSQGPSVT